MIKTIDEFLIYAAVLLWTRSRKRTDVAAHAPDLGGSEGKN